MVFLQSFDLDSTSARVAWQEGDSYRVVVSWVTSEDVSALPLLDRSAQPKSTQLGNPWFGRLRSSSSGAVRPHLLHPLPD